MTTEVAARTKRLVARLMILAVFAMMFGQVAAMPLQDLSSNDEAFGGQRSGAMQSAVDQNELGVPCQHQGNTTGFVCCFAGNCPMLALVLPVAPSARLSTAFRLLAYRHDAMRWPGGTGAAPLVPPPRHLV